MKNVVSDALKHICADVQIRRLGDGIVLYVTNAPREKIRSLRFFNNTFVVITFSEQLNAQDPLKQLIKAVREDTTLEMKLKRLLSKKGRYTIMASVENEPASIPSTQRRKLEKTMSAVFALVPDRQHPNLEFWLLARKEGYGFFGLRLTRHERYDRAPEKGELRPELAHLLCLLSEPSAQDQFLDPFCGSGAIPIERAKTFPFLEVWATDSSLQLVHKLQERVKQLKIPIHVSRADALRLTSFQDDSFDKIVTDPPWGVFQGQSINYFAMLKELRRVTKRGGLVVLLLSRGESLEKMLQQLSLELIHKFDILVSGQKATVYKLKVL